MQSLPSSIGQSIRLKCMESEGCEFNPHGGPFSFMNVYVIQGSPREDLLPAICKSPSVISLKLWQTWINTKHLCGVREAFSFCKACLAQLDRASDSNARNLKAVSSTLMVGLFLSWMYMYMGSPSKDLSPSICKSPSVISLTNYNRLESIQNTCVVWEKLFHFPRPA